MKVKTFKVGTPAKKKVAKKKVGIGETRRLISKQVVITPNRDKWSERLMGYSVMEINRYKVRRRYDAKMDTEKQVKHYKSEADAESAIIKLMAKDQEREDNAKRKVQSCVYSAKKGVDYQANRVVRGYWVIRSRKYIRKVDNTKEEIKTTQLRKGVSLEAADEVVAQIQAKESRK